MYRPEKPSVQVFSRKDIDALGPEWSETYIPHRYPRCKYHWNGKSVTVKNSAEEAALGGGWADTPAAFERYRGLRIAQPDQQNPLKWVDGWSVASLSADHRSKTKAQLLRADAAFWRLPDAESSAWEAMKLAYDGIATVLFEAGVLTEDLLETQVPDLIWDSAIAAGWYRLASFGGTKPSTGRDYSWSPDYLFPFPRPREGSFRYWWPLLSTSPARCGHVATYLSPVCGNLTQAG